MKKINHQQEGYILILTFMILSLATILAMQIFYQATTHIYYNRAMIDREKVRQLVIGGIQVAMSRLALCKDAKDDNKEKEEDIYFRHIFPQIYVTQEFSLTQAKEGIDAKLGIIAMNEHGKININMLYSFKEKKFLNQGKEKGDARKFLIDVCERIERLTKSQDLFKGLEKFLKARNRSLDDPTELLLIPEFQKAFGNNVFYMPISGQKKQFIFLTDIFTVFSSKQKINLLFLSDSIAALYNLNPLFNVASSLREHMLERMKEKKKEPADIKGKWDMYLKNIYGKDFAVFPKDAESFLEFSPDPGVFAIASYGTLGTITQWVYAVFKKNQAEKERQTFNMLRFYWI